MTSRVRFNNKKNRGARVVHPNQMRPDLPSLTTKAGVRKVGIEDIPPPFKYNPAVTRKIRLVSIEPIALPLTINAQQIFASDFGDYLSSGTATSTRYNNVRIHSCKVWGSPGSGFTATFAQLSTMDDSASTQVTKTLELSDSAMMGNATYVPFVYCKWSLIDQAYQIKSGTGTPAVTSVVSIASLSTATAPTQVVVDFVCTFT